MPNYVTNTSNRIKKPIYKNWWFFVIVGIVVLTGIFVVIRAISINDRNKYIENLNTASISMLNGAAKAEDVCNLTHSVWYNTIFKKDDQETDKFTKTDYSWGDGFHSDFNTSLIALYSDNETITKVNNIESNRESVDVVMKTLSDPPKDLELCFGIINDMYSAYYNLTELAVNPSGSLTTFSDDVSKYDGEFMELYNKLELYIPESGKNAGMTEPEKTSSTLTEEVDGLDDDEVAELLTKLFNNVFNLEGFETSAKVSDGKAIVVLKSETITEVYLQASSGDEDAIEQWDKLVTKFLEWHNAAKGSVSALSDSSFTTTMVNGKDLPYISITDGEVTVDLLHLGK